MEDNVKKNNISWKGKNKEESDEDDVNEEKKEETYEDDVNEELDQGDEVKISENLDIIKTVSYIKILHSCIWLSHAFFLYSFQRSGLVIQRKSYLSVKFSPGTIKKMKLINC